MCSFVSYFLLRQILVISAILPPSIISPSANKSRAKLVSCSFASYSVFVQLYNILAPTVFGKQREMSLFLQPRDHSFANSFRDSRWSESPRYLANVFPERFTRRENQHLARLFISRFTPCIICIDASLAYRTTSHRVSYGGKGWIMHEIIRTPNLNALNAPEHNQVILIAVTKRAKESWGRGPPSDEINCSQRDSRVTDIQRDDLKEYQDSKGMREINEKSFIETFLSSIKHCHVLQFNDSLLHTLRQCVIKTLEGK